MIIKHINFKPIDFVHLFAEDFGNPVCTKPIGIEYLQSIGVDNQNRNKSNIPLHTTTDDMIVELNRQQRQTTICKKSGRYSLPI